MRRSVAHDARSYNVDVVRLEQMGRVPECPGGNVLTREVAIEVNKPSWGRRTLPTWALAAAPTQTIDVGRALLMLGSLTTPNGLSPGSPERYWACVRYFSACAASRDLRIRTIFADLDPHQKGILSDDLGVAISTEWLIRQLGGVNDIVDGRRFVINMGVRRKKRERLPKVGPGKCPDFVIEDRFGKFHVLECKGTQSGRAYLNAAMSTGRAQKHGIRVARALRGESLVIGLALAKEGDDYRSQLVVIDPEEEPLTEVRQGDASKASNVMARLSLARALNLGGFSQTAFEIAWPEKMDPDDPEASLLSPAERRSFERTLKDRRRDWQDEIDAELRSPPRRQHGDFFIQEMRFDIPPIMLDSGLGVAKSVTLRRGLKSDLIMDLFNSGNDLRAAAVGVASDVAAGESRISFQEGKNSGRLDYGGLFFSEVVFE